MWVALQSDNPVEISFAQHCLNEAGIWNAVLDDASQAFSGLAGVQGRRLIVNDADADAAFEALTEAGVACRNPDDNGTEPLF
ncbi:MAG: putative signal transducing protein [Alphaproteobacteria bacterium]